MQFMLVDNDLTACRYDWSSFPPEKTSEKGIRSVTAKTMFWDTGTFCL